MSLTSQQQAIVRAVANDSDSILVSARAGTGKTTTIEAAAQAINAPALAVAFNKKIQLELEKRLPKNFLCKTFNGLGHSAWARTISGKIVLETGKLLSIAKSMETMSFDEGVDVMNLVRAARHAGIIPANAPFGKVGLLPDDINSWETLADSKGIDFTQNLIVFARTMLLTSIKQSYAGVIDFDDQIYMPTLFGSSFLQFPFIMVDEAQDLSPLNHLMLKKSLAEGGRLVAVGDPFQAIYGFRGADSDSIESLRKMFNLRELPMTQTFRASRAVVARQASGWVKDFEAHPSVKDGTVEDWGSNGGTAWRLDWLPDSGAIICRNNAPLMSLAFTLIKNKRRGVKILGRDIGASLASRLKKITGKAPIPVEQCKAKLRAWKDREIERATTPAREELIHDQFECLSILLEESGAADSIQAIAFIKDLFSDEAGTLVLTSGHRSKGLEWDWVMHLDPFRVPAKRAVGSQLPQEYNLRYVIETRTRDVLVLANLEDLDA